MLGFSGYEKPWDWKPEQKDDRPPAEYEKPWDQKAKNLEAGLSLSIIFYQNSGVYWLS